MENQFESLMSEVEKLINESETNAQRDVSVLFSQLFFNRVCSKRVTSAPVDCEAPRSGVAGRGCFAIDRR